MRKDRNEAKISSQKMITTGAGSVQECRRKNEAESIATFGGSSGFCLCEGVCSKQTSLPLSQDSGEVSTKAKAIQVRGKTGVAIMRPN